MANDLSSIELMRNDFIVNISHEFKTPIAAIEGYAVLLQEKNLPDEERLLYTQMILDSARQFSILSSNILKLSKLENQDKITQFTNYRLDEQIRNALLYLEKAWTDKDISLELELPKTMLYANEDLMMQVWLNLLSNSIKFTPTNGLIRINIVNKENFIQLHISDTGIGMSSETQKHIFEKFYQGDKSRSIEGNGLGLALVYKILMLHNGKIEVKSELNNGSEFIVTIPTNIKNIYE
jgi:signal transduction histidine kinase